jgi:hypothetical protein
MDNEDMWKIYKIDVEYRIAQDMNQLTLRTKTMGTSSERELCFKYNLPCLLTILVMDLRSVVLDVT